jgi:hypothetical protein
MSDNICASPYAFMVFIGTALSYVKQGEALQLHVSWWFIVVGATRIVAFLFSSETVIPEKYFRNILYAFF